MANSALSCVWTGVYGSAPATGALVMRPAPPTTDSTAAILEWNGFRIATPRRLMVQGVSTANGVAVDVSEGLTDEFVAPRRSIHGRDMRWRAKRWDTSLRVVAICRSTD